MTSMKIVQFLRSPTHFVQLHTKFFHSLDFGSPISNKSPFPNDNQSIKMKQILGRLLYVIRSLPQVGFRFQYQLINSLLSIHFNINSSLSIDFFSFSGSQSRPQSYFKELKASFSSYSYNK